MSEPRRSTRARAREDAAPATPTAPDTPKDTPKGAKATLKRKRTSIAVKDTASPVHTDATSQAPPIQTLPLRLTEGQPLPTLPEPQPLALPPTEWQNIQQSGVLSASLHRSRAVWVSGVNFRTFHAHFTAPKKVAERTDEDKQAMQRQKEIHRNFPQVGAVDAQLVIEPHTFPIKLYGPRELPRQAPRKPHPPPPQYGAWPNHSHHPHHPPPYPPYAHPVYPPKHPHPPQHAQPRPPPPKPAQHTMPTAPNPGPTSTPAPDPVIHMLAARAGTDPELKAVMKIVAAGQATKEQLEFFQTHINELTEILAKQKEPKPPMPLPPKHSQTPVPAHPRPVQPAQQQQQPQQQHTPKPYSPAPLHTPTHPPLQQAPPVRPHPPPHTYNTTNYNQPPPPHYQPHQMPQYNAPPPPRTTYRPLTFEFVEGNGDRFYFPSYSFMEWLPNGSGAKFSFLVTKMKPKPKSDSAPKPPSTPAAPQAPTPNVTPAPNATPGPNTTPGPNVTPTPNANATPTTPMPTTAYVPPPRIEDFDEKNDIADIEFYQPVTVLVLTDEPEIKNSLPRAIRPPAVVEKYMDNVFDTCKRAEETYLAFRLPKEGALTDADTARSGDATPAVATPTADAAMSASLEKERERKKSTQRSRKSIA